MHGSFCKHKTTEEAIPAKKKKKKPHAQNLLSGQADTLRQNLVVALHRDESG
jgi:hypothetical protein